MFKAIITGNIGKSAVLAKAGDRDVTRFRVATVRWDGRSKSEVTTWVSVSLFGPRAIKLHPHLTKGHAVTVSGDLSVTTYLQDGETRLDVRLDADDVALQGGARREGGEVDHEIVQAIQTNGDARLAGQAVAASVRSTVAPTTPAAIPYGAPPYTQGDEADAY